jgi:hypothetical protein
MTCSYTYCGNSSVFNPIPPEIKLLEKNNRFQKYKKEDLLAFHLQFKNITKGRKYLTKKQFKEILASFNVF